MGFVICGPAKGLHKKYKCICCGMESDDPEDFAVSMCWECGISENGKKYCDNCKAMREAEARGNYVGNDGNSQDHDNCSYGSGCTCQHKTGDNLARDAND